MDFGTLLHMAKKNSEDNKNDVSKSEKIYNTLVKIVFHKMKKMY